MAYPSSARLFPDLQKYFRKYMITNQLDRYEVPVPGEIHEEHFDDCRSFIRMMFDDDWHFPNYTHCYTDILDYSAWPVSIRDRMMIYTHSKYFLPCCDSTNMNYIYQQCDSTATNFLNSINHSESTCCIDSTASTNLFHLENDDFMMLDALNVYRCDTTSVIIYEHVDVANNSFTKMIDQNKWLLNISFNSLNTPLSKLIFIYLNLKINDDYLFYMWNGNDFIGIGVFTYLYELYVIDNIFQYMVKKGPDYIETV